MRVNVRDVECFQQPIVGNVYAVSGGYGRRAGHLMVLISITEKGSALFIVVDKSGEVVGVTSYGIHAIEERAPVAFVPGLADLSFEMEAVR